MTATKSLPVQPPRSAEEEARVASLHGLAILDTPPEKRFDRITELAARVFDVPIALVSLVDSDRQWFKSCVGLDVSETSREFSFCSHAILTDDPMVVPNALLDARFANNPLVTGPPGIRFYAGVPLADASGRALGTLCVIDAKPRTFGVSEIEILRQIAVWAETELNSIGLERTTQLLVESEMLYRSVISAVEEGVVVRDQTGSIVACNASAERILGLRAEQIMGQSEPPPDWWTVDAEGAPLLGSDHPAAVTLRTGQARTGVTIGVHRPNADLTWLSVNAQPLVRPGESQPFAAVSSFTDVTERLAVERMKTEFVSIVSHELRTPLTSVRGALDMIRDGEAGEIPPMANRMAEIATSNTDRLIRLINDMLDIERIEAGRVGPVKQEIDPGTLFQQVVDELQPLAERSCVTLITTSSAMRVLVDPDQILQALTNLIGNAIKFSPPGGSVRLSASEDGDVTVFRVADEGPGIPEDELEAVFDRFHQVSASEVRQKGGTGLGLAICRGIVEQHGGRIWVDSVLGEGSTFTFTLPAADLRGGSGAAEPSLATETASEAQENPA